MNWQTVRLEEIFEIARGGSPRPIDAFITDAADGINWISIKDATKSGKYISKTKLKIRPEGLKKSRLVHPGDFLLTNSMSFGRPYIMNTTGCIHDGWLVLSADKKRVDEEYFYYLLGSELLHRKFSSLAAGAVVKNLNINLVKGVEIPLPPLAEQKQIATILDASDSLRQKDQQLVEHYIALSQSLFLEMFGDPVTNPMKWDLIKLRDICGVGSSKRVFVNEFVRSGVPFYRGTEVGHLGSGKNIKPHLFISEQHYERLKEESGVPEIGDLLLPSICHDGRIWRVTTKKPFYFKDGRVLWIKVDNDTINGEYLRYFLKGLFLTNYSNYASGTTFAELKIVALKGMGILNPPIKLQNQFAERIAIIEQQKQQAQTNLQMSEALFNSLLQRAFTGELTADKAA